MNGFASKHALQGRCGGLRLSSQHWGAEAERWSWWLTEAIQGDCLKQKRTEQIWVPEEDRISKERKHTY